MIWLGVAAGMALLVIGIVVPALRRARDDVHAATVDPLVAGGIAITGAGAVLVTTLGSVMYAVMAVGLAVLALGTYRARHHSDG